MRAAVHTKYGPPEVVHVTEVDRPVPRGNQILVRVHATTVNRTDCGFRANNPFFVRLFAGVRGPKATVLGCEFAGVVDGVGSDVTQFAIGDRVFGYDDARFGGHAEYVVIAEDAAVAPIPAGVDFETAAAGTEGSHYALCSIRAAKVDAGQAVLVNGATGGIGSAAVQLLKVLGADVTAVCATPHLDLVSGLGADRVVDYTVEDFTADDRRYDVVLDAVGKSSFGKCKRLLKDDGIYLSSELGPRAENPFLALVTPLLRGRRVMFPIPSIDQAMVRYLGDLIGSGQFKPVIDRRYPLEQIVDAYRYVESGKKIGNVVITVAKGGPGSVPP